MGVDAVAKKARSSISRFCIEECKAYCCRKGILILKSPKEMKKTVNGKKDFLLENRFLRALPNDEFSLNLGNSGSCPSLKDNLCLIHKSRNRSMTCKNFPVFIRDDKIVLSPNCLAVRENRLYPFIHRFRKLGYKVE